MRAERELRALDQSVVSASLSPAERAQALQFGHFELQFVDLNLLLF
jgi:hypothetical protein